MPKTIDDIDTPAVIIDVDRAMANIIRAQQFANSNGIKLRPHIKTHKLPYFAKKQIEAGAVGITCQKIGEAEVMADAGIDDIFITYNILGSEKLNRLLALHKRNKLSVVVDNQRVLSGLAEKFTDTLHPLSVLVECDTGMGRCGVQNSKEALALAQSIASHQGLHFAGLMTYPRSGKAKEAEHWLSSAKDVLLAVGIVCETISSGGTPDMWQSFKNSCITEYRPGTYIYLDRSQVEHGVGGADDCALHVLTTIVSHPTPARAIIDAGSKALSSDTLGLEGFGEVVGHPQVTITGLNEEHGILATAGAPLGVGDRLRVLPNHACVVSNLFDEVYFTSGQNVVGRMQVAARGRVG